jgi:hypothetical protein
MCGNITEAWLVLPTYYLLEVLCDYFLNQLEYIT